MFTLADGSELEYMTFGSADGAPLLMLHSVEYATMPPWQFCLDAKEAGFRIIAVRRPGFGRSTPCASYTDQVGILFEFIDQLDTRDIHLHATGSAGLLGYALLVKHSAISEATLCNFAYGKVTNAEFQRVGLAQIDAIKQAVRSKLGCKLLLAGLRASKGIVGSGSMGERFFCRNEADTNFFHTHYPEILDSADTVMRIAPNTLHQELNSLVVEAAQMYGRPEKPFTTLIGGDAPEVFRNVALGRSKTLGGRNILTENYDYFVGFAEFLNTLESKTYT